MFNLGLLGGLLFSDFILLMSWYICRNKVQHVASVATKFQKIKMDLVFSPHLKE